MSVRDIERFAIKDEENKAAERREIQSLKAHVRNLITERDKASRQGG